MSDSTTLGSLASSVTGSYTSLSKLITSGSYLAGLGFSTAAIVKFKSHKDNPTQVPVGTPAALAAVGAALIYLPSVISTVGSTSFGLNTSAGGTVSGVTASEVEEEASKAGITLSGVTVSDVKAAASEAGITSTEVDAAKSAVKDKLG